MRNPATADDVVKALNDLTDSGIASERTALQSLGMGPNDAKVLRFLLQRKRDDEPVTPRMLASMLGISSAATTALIDRLAESGWVAREPYPGDRRSIVVRETIDADSPARRILSVRRASAAAAAERLGPAERRIVADFLEDLARAETEDMGEMCPRDDETPRTS
ncbi:MULTISPECIES: MarR family winged helix-turn-helix transcriptional regulator [Microbacterium]|uniref:MarR family winged helix-turn-helix transcriptional regulator n=1 Tax=Microbacterium TaxID=33882 RepID=UPI0027848212|nr:MULTISPECIES: MarR family transcriptional regulator [Microbacterium]MDQ1082851.1 DNA-binding MarR family transcriptional regulator [Microbacterium sp. SORGH_AS_0344]MDQ1168380.1 DNA-binding MarR family transcriptional regulator [Microbacterium proteolyticum]